MNTLRIKKLTETAIIPTRGSSGAAGFDLYADSFTIHGNDTNITQDSAVLNCGENITVHTGISMAIPHGWVGLVYPRSGLGCKKGIRLANSTGVIDEDYRGEIMVCLHRDRTGNPDIDKPELINKNDRIAQIVFVPYLGTVMEETTDLDETERGANGFGSTGVSAWSYDPNKLESEKCDMDRVADFVKSRNYTPTEISLEDLCARIIADAEESIECSGANNDGVSLYDENGMIDKDVLAIVMEGTNLSELDYKS